MQDVTFYLVRHGATAGNLEKRYVGRTDEPLTAEWESKLAEASGTVPQVEAVFTSPMLRCRQTAVLLYPDREPIIVPGFEETDFGRFEYKNYQELDGDPDYQRWIDSKGLSGFPGGETLEQFEDRVEQAFRSVVLDYLKKTKINKAALILHGGVIMALLDRLGDGSTPFFRKIPQNGEFLKAVWMKKVFYLSDLSSCESFSP